MNVLKAIMERRSIRQFTNAPILEKDLKTILEAAMNAPSAGDGRPWHFVVTTDREKLDALADQIDQGNEMFKQAQAAILVCGDASLEKFPGFYPQDCSCAAQNIYLASHSLGLGTVWVACWNVPPRMEGCRNILKIPENIMPFAIFPLGYSAEDLQPEYRYDEARVHRDEW